MKGYSFWIGLRKGVIAVVLFAIPMFINYFPGWANLTIGGVLIMLVNFIKVVYKKA